ncbi:hypothetical protein KCP69_24860 [Salmonella enterica subsp. enterica]|nr:hypothetical protein KCP69_24860 [Salmonella enterica subsp. enterica]
MSPVSRTTSSLFAESAIALPTLSVAGGCADSLKAFIPEWKMAGGSKAVLLPRPDGAGTSWRTGKFYALYHRWMF